MKARPTLAELEAEIIRTQRTIALDTAQRDHYDKSIKDLQAYLAKLQSAKKVAEDKSKSTQG